MTKITQKEVLSFLRAHGHAIGEERLGFHPLEIGNEPIRSGTAMGWFLGGEKDCHIMIVGRWNSLFFMKCLREQTLDFCKGMSKMLLRNEFFHAFPDPAR